MKNTSKSCVRKCVLILCIDNELIMKKEHNDSSISLNLALPISEVYKEHYKSMYTNFDGHAFSV